MSTSNSNAVATTTTTPATVAPGASKAQRAAAVAQAMQAKRAAAQATPAPQAQATPAQATPAPQAQATPARKPRTPGPVACPAANVERTYVPKRGTGTELHLALLGRPQGCTMQDLLDAQSALRGSPQPRSQTMGGVRWLASKGYGCSDVGGVLRLVDHTGSVLLWAPATLAPQAPATPAK